jgi:hypothetical protein
MLEIDSLKASSVVSDEIDYADCSVFLADLTDLREKYASKCNDSVSKINLLIIHHFYPFCIFNRLLYYINLFANFRGL